MRNSVVLFLGLLLSACGKTGALFLPEEPEQQAPAPQPPAQPAEPAEEPKADNDGKAD